MASRGDYGALAIRVPRNAPAVELKNSRDALIDECSPFAVINNRAVLRAVTSRQSINLLRVYIALLGHVNKQTGLASPSQTRLATLLGIDRRTVNRAMRKLIELELIRIDHKRPAPGGKGSLLFFMPIYADKSITAADAQSIAQPMGHPTVSQANTPLMRHPGVTVQTYRDTLTPKNGSPYETPNCPIASETPILSHELSEHKNPHAQPIEKPDDVLRQWEGFVWMHGGKPTTANEDDLLVAHDLVELHITAAQLETAVLTDPTAERLRSIAVHFSNGRMTT